MNFIDDVRAAWDQPPAEYRSAPFWSWNSKLDPDRLQRQIESMHRAGMGGFFMHSRYGLKTPYLSEEWFECISACVDKARELGMKAYLYDEDRWPSGAAGGAVTRENTEFRSHFLAMLPPDHSREVGEHVGLFAMELDGDGRLVSYESIDEVPDDAGGRTIRSFDVFTVPDNPWHNDGGYLDTLNPDAVAEFIHVTHQAYADRYGKDFGDLIPAIFTDEPHMHLPAWVWTPDDPVIRWTGQLPREFISRRGYDVRDHLPELLIPHADGAFSGVRADFHRTTTEMFVEAFSRQIGQWCDKHDLALTGHMLAEGTLASQGAHVGACMPHYRHMQWPGIDILTDQDEELITAKQCSSVADQLGKQRVLSELYGCTGWDWPLEGHKFVGDWHLAAGVNFRCPHLSHYSLAGGAKRDYPASIRDHSPWWKHYRPVEDYFGRMNLMLTQGTPIRDVLVIHPVESAWGLWTPTGDSEPIKDLDEPLAEIARTLTELHVDWDFGDESLLDENAQVGRDGLTVGQMTYRVVVVPPCLTLRSSTQAMLEEFAQAGHAVVICGEGPKHVDGRLAEDSADPLAGIADARRVEPTGADLARAATDAVGRRVSIADEGGDEATFCWTMLREIKGGRLLLIDSHDRQEAHDVKVTVQGRTPVMFWDALTGRREKVDATQEGDYVTFDLHLPVTGSALLTLGVGDSEATAHPGPAEQVASQAIEGPWPIRLLEPNTFPMDYCRLTIGQGQESDPMPVLKADAAIREHFGLDPRGGRKHQPWYLYGTGVIDREVRGPCRLRWTFHVTDLPIACKLALENPEDYVITVNGSEVMLVDGFWVDEDIRTLDITALLVEGDNEIALELQYRPDMEIEDIYLVGDFGVAVRDGLERKPGNLTITARPDELRAGSWVGQGLDHYGGGVRYELNVDRPAGDGRVMLDLSGVACTAAVVHVGEQSIVLPWPPYEAEVTHLLAGGRTKVFVDVFGGRKNILGPLHVPWGPWTGPGEFEPSNRAWTDEYLLVDHGLLEAPKLRVLKQAKPG